MIPLPSESAASPPKQSLAREAPASRASLATWSVIVIPLLFLLGACGDDPSSTVDDAGSPNSEGDGGIARDGSADSAPGACEDGTWDHDRNPATACVAWSTCAAGTYVTNTPSATADRKCAGCRSGSFSAKPNEASCTAWTTCAPGSYVSTVASAVADRQCAPCAAGTYSSSPNQSACLSHDACAAGWEQSVTATPTSPSECAPCEIGTHCAGGATAKQACGSGTWDHDRNPATACAPWTACVPGQQVRTFGSATIDQTCLACFSGFSTTTNAASCAPWTSCTPGTYVRAIGTTIADRQCTACPEGLMSSTTNASACAPNPLELAAGFHHTCARLADGSVRCWGRNSSGQLGDGTRTHRPLPTAVPGLANVIEIAVGDDHTCARLTDGTVRCWGVNTFGQAGDGTTTSWRVSPTAVPGLSNVAELAAGGSHTCARLTDGTVRCWGDNWRGQLGDGTLVESRLPTAVPGLSGVAALAAGNAHTCARLTDGTVRCWGGNWGGQLGDGTTTDRLSPVAVPELSGVAELAAGYRHTCARLTDGSVSCWGNNWAGQLGSGTTADSSFPPAVVPGVSGVTQLAAGDFHTCARLTEGSASCWGNNVNAALNGIRTGGPSPEAIAGLSGVIDLAAGWAHTCARLTDFSIRCWGDNAYGQLGEGTSLGRISPTVVPW